MSMEDMAKRIRDLRRDRGLTLEQVATVVGVGKSTVRKWETGMIANMRRDKIASLATALGTTPAYLMGWDDDPVGFVQGARPISTVSLPLLGNVACGEPTFAEENVQTYIEADEGTRADFCLRVKGDSMINARIFDGDVIFVKKQDMVDDGEIAVVLIEDEATVKRVYYDRDNNVLTLIPENPTYKPMRYVGPELDTVRILGKVLAGQYRVV